MKRTLTFITIAIGVAILAGSALAAATGGQAASVKFRAVLTAAQETDHPKGVKAGASGLFTATLTGKTLKWTLTWKNLTGPANQAHIHKGKRGVGGDVLVPLCPPGCTSPNHGTAVVTTAAIKLMKSGGTYVNVHTTKNILGEIRGQISQAK